MAGCGFAAMTKPRKIVLRIVGVSNLGHAALGLILVGMTIYRVDIAPVPPPPGLSQEHIVVFYWLFTMINLAFLAGLVFLGIALLRLSPNAVVLCNWLFGAEILNVFLLGAMWAGTPNPLNYEIAAATGIGNMGISPQSVTWYPVIATIVLNITWYWRGR